MDYGRKHAHQTLFVAHQLLEEEMMQDFALFLRVNIKRVQRGNYTMALVSLPCCTVGPCPFISSGG